MRISPRVLGFIGLGLVGAGATSAQAINIGVLDNFQDGTLMNWLGGTTITNVGGGQGGALDRYLSVDANGNTGGSGSKVGCHNSDGRWAGNYIAAGVTGIQVDMINLNTTTLQMRLVVFGLGSRWTSSTAVTLSPGSGWQHVMFPINPSSLTRVLGSATFTDTLSDANQIMFRHDGGTPSSGGEAINGTVGMDNLLAVPAPGAAGILAAGWAWAGRRRRAR
jgi:hypothetical protein